MASANQIVFDFIGNDQVSSVISGISTSMDGLSTAGYMALQDVGQKAKEVSDEIVQAAASAEQGWIAFNNGISNVGADLASSKAQVISLAAELGRSTVDVRQFETTMLNMGASVQTAEAGVRAASAAAAGSGKDFAQVQSAIISAMKGRGMALKELGFDINNYKNAETGAIDTTRLYADVQAKFANAQGAYANSFVANNQRLQNALMGLKTDLGQGAMSLENVFLPALTTAVNGIRMLPGPLKAVAGVGVDAVGTFVSMSAEIANVTKAIEGISNVAKLAGDGLSMLSSITKTTEAATTALTLADLANESVEVQSAAAHAGSTAMYVAETGAKDAATVSTWSLAAAEGALLGPILIIIGVIGILVAAVYEAGKSMGWWSDVNGMLQAGINALSGALQWLYGCIQPVLEVIGGALIWALQSAYNAIQSVIGVLYTIGGAAQAGFSAFASAVNTVLGPLNNVYNSLVKVGNAAKSAGQWLWSKITGAGGELALQDSMQYRAMLQSQGITAKVGNTSNKQNIQFNIDSVDVSANNLSPTEAKQVMISALESLNNVESVKLRRAV